MKRLSQIILLIIFCIMLSPVIANETDESEPDESEVLDLKREAVYKNVDDDIDKSNLEKRKKKKNKKGERNVKIQPSQEDDENIILELDED